MMVKPKGNRRGPGNRRQKHSHRFGNEAFWGTLGEILSRGANAGVCLGDGADRVLSDCACVVGAWGRRIRIIFGQFIDVRAILVSDHLPHEVEDQLLRRGLRACLSKPFEPGDLLAAVSAALAPAGEPD